jgi:hypothetical protein
VLLVVVGLVAALAAAAVWTGARRKWLRMTTASGEDVLVDLNHDTAEPRARVSVG